MDYGKRSLEYHSRPTPGKISILPTKPCRTAEDLALAYTPGVAEPCKRIAADPLEVFRYTSRGNLVAVVTNGTRVLGLGDIGPAAAKPVMEGKGILFKRFADVDVFDLELDTKDPDEFIRTVEILAPTFGGINLEDIRNPDCFYIERELTRRLSIPVFHDDQHGTAIITAAGLLNAAMLQEKRVEDLRVVLLGAGAAGVAIGHQLLEVGVLPENLLVCDSTGVLHVGREQGLNEFKRPFLRDTRLRRFDEAIRGADVFVGTAGAGLFTADHLRAMAPRPVVFALANPDPEIDPALAHATRDDVIVATGRSDYPNQCNNVLVFPFVFRGALDVSASTFNQEMKRAAVNALAALAREPVPEEVSRSYEGQRFEFGKDYILPKPFDPRVLTSVAPAVARAAIESGVAQRRVEDWYDYRVQLEKRFGLRLPILKQLKLEARRDPKTLVFPEGASPLVLQAVERILEDGFARPLLLGDRGEITARLQELGIGAEVEIVDPLSDPRREDFAEILFSIQGRRGGSRFSAREAVKMCNTFACLMLREGHADAMISGAEATFPESVRPAFQIVGLRPGARRVAGIHMVALGGRMFFFADTSVNVDPTAEQLADIALSAARLAEAFRIRPRVAMLSYSSFGSVADARSEKVRLATRFVRELDPELVVEGEIAPDVALSPEVVDQHYPQSLIKGDANVLVFPDLASGNLAYKTVEHMAGAKAVGPLLVGFDKPVCILPQGATVENIVNMAAIMAIAAIHPSTLGSAPEVEDLRPARRA